ncbi:glycosyltransferase [Candidatus Lokiarchaeum ossiferum]
MNKNKGICVVNFPILKTGVKPVFQLIQIIKQVKDTNYLICGSLDNHSLEKMIPDIHYIKIDHRKMENFFFRIVSYIRTQILMTIEIIKLKNVVETYLFFIGTEDMIIPHLVSKILRKKTLFLLAGFPSKRSYSNKDLFFIFQKALSKINFFLTNKVLVYSKEIITERNLHYLDKKIAVFQRHYIPHSEILFKNISKKKENIGFLGEICLPKGIQNLIVAIKQLKDQKVNVNLHIGGFGEKKFVDKLKKYIEKTDLKNQVFFHGWINREDIPLFLSNMKYFILPSLSEGLPNVLLEAMGCGCCVISTKVGGIPDIIVDSVNGILLESNSTDAIVDGFLRTKSLNLDILSKNASEFIKKKFSFKYSVENFRSIYKKI